MLAPITLDEERLVLSELAGKCFFLLWGVDEIYVEGVLCLRVDGLTACKGLLGE